MLNALLLNGTEWIKKTRIIMVRIASDYVPSYTSLTITVGSYLLDGTTAWNRHGRSHISRTSVDNPHPKSSSYHDIFAFQVHAHVYILPSLPPFSRVFIEQVEWNIRSVVEDEFPSTASNSHCRACFMQ